jgi:peptidylprolyl isomerase
MRTNALIAAVLISWLSVFSSACTRESAPADTAPAKPPGIPAPADVASPPADASRTPTGLASKVLKAGTGTRHPRPNSRVTVHYTGWTTDGAMFDSSVVRNEPASFSLDGVIPGWTEGVQMMVEGEKRRFWIPESIAYGGAPGQPKGMLVFDIELIRIDS